MKIIFFLLLLANTTVTIFAQNSIRYVCYSTGLNIRKSASLQAAVVGKIPYGTKLTINLGKTDTVPVVVEGMTGFWTPVNYGSKKGWVLNCYLTQLKPPTKGTNTMEEYLAQISAPYGGKLIISNDVVTTIEAGGRRSAKQLFKNGAQHNSFSMYEYKSDTYMIPLISMQEAFIIIRQIQEFADFFTEKDAFPTTSKKWEKPINGLNASCTQAIFNLGNDKTMPIHKISMQMEHQSLQVLDIYTLEDEIIIFKSIGI